MENSNKIVGYVFHAETGLGIPNLVVEVLDVDPGKFNPDRDLIYVTPGLDLSEEDFEEKAPDVDTDKVSTQGLPADRLGSVVTDSNGYFELTYKDAAFQIRKHLKYIDYDYEDEFIHDIKEHLNDIDSNLLDLIIAFSTFRKSIPSNTLINKSTRIHNIRAAFAINPENLSSLLSIGSTIVHEASHSYYNELLLHCIIEWRKQTGTKGFGSWLVRQFNLKKKIAGKTLSIEELIITMASYSPGFRKKVHHTESPYSFSELIAYLEGFIATYHYTKNIDTGTFKGLDKIDVYWQRRDSAPNAYWKTQYGEFNKRVIKRLDKYFNGLQPLHKSEMKKYVKSKATRNEGFFTQLIKDKVIK